MVLDICVKKVKTKSQIFWGRDGEGGGLNPMFLEVTGEQLV